MHLARKLGIWKRERKGKVREGHGSSWSGNLGVNTMFKVMDSFLVLHKFTINADVPDIGNGDIILELC